MEIASNPQLQEKIRTNSPLKPEIIAQGATEKLLKEQQTTTVKQTASRPVGSVQVHYSNSDNSYEEPTEPETSAPEPTEPETSAPEPTEPTEPETSAPEPSEPSEPESGEITFTWDDFPSNTDTEKKIASAVKEYEKVTVDLSSGTRKKLHIAGLSENNAELEIIGNPNSDTSVCFCDGLKNSGTLTLNAVNSAFYNKFENSGDITLDNSSDNPQTIEFIRSSLNSGSICVSGNFSLSSIYHFENSGQLTVDGSLTIPFYFTLHNHSEVINNGTIINNGTFINDGQYTENGGQFELKNGGKVMGINENDISPVKPKVEAAETQPSAKPETVPKTATTNNAQTK